MHLFPLPANTHMRVKSPSALTPHTSLKFVPIKGKMKYFAGFSKGFYNMLSLKRLSNVSSHLF